ncbi:hypothetical protein GALMADRAFT_140309 [Galerina marginata CBS 339.88]|uniref:Uncharacterized protein n=1 Tax=Galerina marginata (strain CBS 339.88) TaxID=685588 RepID=A0A067T6Z2_GALM3|nr:hypothetical protein GALMADRAFT_140309 [Galerina marginata CBS 339.88]
MAAHSITPEMLTKMTVQELLVVTATHIGLATSMDKGELIRQLCEKLGFEVHDRSATDPTLRLKKKAARTSHSIAEGSSDAAGGPVRSPKKDVIKAPYARTQRSQRKNLNTRDRPEKEPSRPLSPGVLNDGTPESSPEPEDRRSTAPLATHEVAKDTVEMMSNIQRQLQLLAEENKQVVKQAKKIRAVATALQRQLTAERQRTERLITYLKYWQRIDGKWGFSSIFPRQDVILRRLDGDTQEIEVDEADVEYDPQLAVFLESEEVRNRNRGSENVAATGEEDETMDDTHIMPLVPGCGVTNQDKGKENVAATEPEPESMNHHEGDEDAEFAEATENARKLSRESLRQESADRTDEGTNAEASGSGTRSKADYLAEWKKFPVPVRSQRVRQSDGPSRYLAPVDQGPFAYIHNEYFHGRGPYGKLPSQAELDASAAQSQPRQPSTSTGGDFSDSSVTADSEQATRLGSASKHLGYAQTRRPLSRQGSAHIDPAVVSSLQLRPARSTRPLSRQDSIRPPPPSSSLVASQPIPAAARRQLARQDSMRFVPPASVPSSAPLETLRRAGTPRPLSRDEIEEDDPITEEAHSILNTVFGPYASSSTSTGGRESRRERSAPGNGQASRPLGRDGGFMVSPPPDARRARNMAPPPPPGSISAREREIVAAEERVRQEFEDLRRGIFAPSPTGLQGRRL